MKMRIVLDEGAKMPQRAHPYDAGLDLFVRTDGVIPARGSAVFDTGVHVEIPEGCAGFIKSKSGLNVRHDIQTEGVITDCKFNTFGCGSAIATSSMATDLIIGKPIDEALQLSNHAVVEALDGLPVHKLHCSVLAEQAVRAAVKDYYDRKGIAYNEADFVFPEEDEAGHVAE